MTTTGRLSDSELARCRREYVENGYFVLRGVVDPDLLAGLHQALAREFDRASREDGLFSGGGLISGHLNCFPGEGTRAVYESLLNQGIVDFLKELDPRILRLPNVGCNFNLPGSHTQHWHTDYPFTRDFMIVNVTLVDTNTENGATDIIPATHKKFYKYTRFVLERVARNSMRVETKRGDVVVRNANLWHRGMTNLTRVPRPMLAFTWEDGGSKNPDPFRVNDGKIRFLPNWFKPTRAGRIRERVFVRAPFVYSALRFGRSLFDSEY